MSVSSAGQVAAEPCVRGLDGIASLDELFTEVTIHQLYGSFAFSLPTLTPISFHSNVLTLGE